MRLRINERFGTGLVAASSGAAAFDAWTTRRAVSGGYGVERDPLLRPFAHSNAIYAATQVSPASHGLSGPPDDDKPSRMDAAVLVGSTGGGDELLSRCRYSQLSYGSLIRCQRAELLQPTRNLPQFTLFLSMPNAI